MRVVMPHSLHSLSQQDEVSRHLFEEGDAYCQATLIDYTDGGRNVDERKTLLNQMQFSDETVSDSIRPDASHRRPIDANRSSSANVMSNSFKTQGSGSSATMRPAQAPTDRAYSQDMKVQVVFKNSLPFKEQP